MEDEERVDTDLDAPATHRKLNSSARIASLDTRDIIQIMQPVADFNSKVKDDEKVVEEEKKNINLRAAIVHMIGDMVQSAGVIVAALIIYFKPDWTIADPICTFLFSILVMITTVPIFKDCMRHLMETAPDDSCVEVYNAIATLPFVCRIDDFHLWSLSEDKPVFMAHIVVNCDVGQALHLIKDLLKKEFEIYFATL